MTQLDCPYDSRDQFPVHGLETKLATAEKDMASCLAERDAAIEAQGRQQSHLVKALADCDAAEEREEILRDALEGVAPGKCTCSEDQLTEACACGYVLARDALALKPSGLLVCECGGRGWKIIHTGPMTARTVECLKCLDCGRAPSVPDRAGLVETHDVYPPRPPHPFRPTVTLDQLICSCPTHPCPVHGFESIASRYKPAEAFTMKSVVVRKYKCPHCGHEEEADEPPTCDSCIKSFNCVSMVEVPTTQNGEVVVSKTPATPGGTTPEKASGHDPASGGTTIVCARCNDTHLMWLDDRQVPCTSCPTPCDKCRIDYAAFCERTPCPCVCHCGKFEFETRITPNES